MNQSNMKKVTMISAQYYMHARTIIGQINSPIACRVYQVFPKSQMLKELLTSKRLSEATIQVPLEEMSNAPIVGNVNDEYLRNDETRVANSAITPVYKFRDVMYNIDSMLGDLGWWVSYIDSGHCVWVISLKDWKERFTFFQYPTC